MAASLEPSLYCSTILSILNKAGVKQQESHKKIKTKHEKQPNKKVFLVFCAKWQPGF